MPLGAPLSLSQGFLVALQSAQKRPCDCLQIFSEPPRQGSAAPLDSVKAEAFFQAWSTAKLGLLVVHDSRFTNLAAPNIAGMIATNLETLCEWQSLYGREQKIPSFVRSFA